MEKLEINKQIPFGASLQEVLNHPSLTDSKLKYFLRSKGVFIENDKPNSTYPILLSTLISPLEFEYIKENIRTKETNRKILSRPLEWHESRDVIEVIPPSLNLKQFLSDEGFKDKIIQQTNFVPIDGDKNRVKMTYKCQTTNYNSGWYRTKNEYDGEIIVEKVNDENKVYLRIIYTSPETYSVGNVGTQKLVEEFKQNGYTKPNAEIERILYSNFNNEERLDFFLSLTKNNKIFDFQRVTNIEIAPDRTQTLTPEIYKFMTGNVNVLNMDGESLHEHFLIKNRENHKFVEISNIEALYNFSYTGAEGNCVVRYGFLGYFKKRISNIEFSIDISSLNLKPEFRTLNKDKVKSQLLQEFEKFKIETYNKLKTIE